MVLALSEFSLEGARVKAKPSREYLSMNISINQGQGGGDFLGVFVASQV